MNSRSFLKYFECLILLEPPEIFAIFRRHDFTPGCSTTKQWPRGRHRGSNPKPTNASLPHFLPVLAKNLISFISIVFRHFRFFGITANNTVGSSRRLAGWLGGGQKLLPRFLLSSSQNPGRTQWGAIHFKSPSHLVHHG